MKNKKYDFAGWVTKNDVACADGLTIKHGAFKGNDKKRVPLVWNHNHGVPGNVLGHVMLHNRDEGIYGYGYLNESSEAIHAKTLIEHGDISAMSIGANRLKKQGKNVVHGRIYEVSLVLAGANPGALIESVMAHSDDGDDEESGKAIIYTDYLIHSDDGEDEDVEEDLEHKGDKKDMAEDKTVGEIVEDMSDEQKKALEFLIAKAMENGETAEQSDTDEGEDDDMKHNVFSSRTEEDTTEVLTHSEMEAIFDDAKSLGSLKDSMVEHGITGIETLFPEAKQTTNAPIIYRDENTAGSMIVNGTSKSPFSRIKTLYADLTEEDARAKGYVKGNEKFEQVFSLFHRTTQPQTIYKKQKLDRDDIIDITDFDVVSWINAEMKVMLKEELGRAILVGDGRGVSHADKIKTENIRPIIDDDDLYTIKKTAADVESVIETVIKAMAEYEGSGAPTMFLSPTMLADLRLLKKTDGSFLFGDIPTAQSIAARLGVKALQPTTFLQDDIVIVNLKDYRVGATKGGEVTTFDDFDIDFNQYKYLIETRVSGALDKVKSAIKVTVTTPEAG